MSSVSIPIFTITTQNGPFTASLFEVFALAASDGLTDLPMLVPHQRAGVVTALAIFMHVLSRYYDVERSDPASWKRAWLDALSEGTFALTAPHTEVAFLQPPTDEPTSRQSLESADLLLPNVEHEVKCTWSGTAEQVLFALLGGISRPSVKDHRSSTRIGQTVVLPSDDGTIGNEIMKLVEAYDALFPAAEGNARDHLPWLLPYRPKAPPLAVHTLPKPFLDVGRALRVREVSGRFEIWACPINTSRTDGGDPWLDDPHTPKLVGDDGVRRYKLGRKTFDHAFIHKVLFGASAAKEIVVRPRILDLTSYRQLRVCALGSEQGKTVGYREVVFSASRDGQRFSLEPPDAEDRPARVATRMLQTIKVGNSILYAALGELYQRGTGTSETAKGLIATGLEVYNASIRFSSAQLVLELLTNRDEDLAAEQRLMDEFVADAVTGSFEIAETVHSSVLAKARAEDRLRTKIRNELKGVRTVKSSTVPRLVAQTFGIVQGISKGLTPGDQARLRTMSLAAPSMTFWKLMAEVPTEQLENERCLGVWARVLSGLGSIKQSQSGLGSILKRTDFPEDRLSRLLEVTGPSMAGLIGEVIQWLTSHRVPHVDLSRLLALGLADALGDDAARDWTRREIALGYVRTKSGQQRSTGENGDEGEGDVRSDSLAS